MFFSIPLTFIEITITTLLFTTIFNISSAKKTKFMYIFVFSLFSIFLNVCIPTPYNTFINVLVCPVLIILFFKTNIFRAILAEIIPYIIFVLVGTLVLNFYLNILRTSTDILISVPLYKLMLSTSIYVLVYIIYYIFKHFKINITLFTNLKEKTSKVLLINFFIGIIAIAVQSYVASVYSDVLPLGVILLNISTLLFYFIFSLYSLIRTNKLEATERDLELSKQYINTLTILHDSIRGFKHDFNNIVTTIGRLCTNK